MLGSYGATEEKERDDDDDSDMTEKDDKEDIDESEFISSVNKQYNLSLKKIIISNLI